MIRNKCLQFHKGDSEKGKTRKRLKYELLRIFKGYQKKHNNNKTLPLAISNDVEVGHKGLSLLYFILFSYFFLKKNKLLKLVLKTD